MRSPLPPKKPKPEPKNSTAAFYGPRALWKRISEIAAEDNRSASDLVVGILEQWLERYDKKRKR